MPSDKFAIGDVVAGSNVTPVALDFLQRGGFPVSTTSDIRLEKWRKLLINIAFNPLDALSHLDFGEVLDIQDGDQLARSLAKEALYVANSFRLSEGIDMEAAFERATTSATTK
ncbi:MAG: hypothetical protein CBARDMAM_6086 [uncultured Caballeronia sp.]|nr:MAG: hypothetical protein CBARDMAM_6086 [uncultured Caballeronia sp.]